MQHLHIFNSQCKQLRIILYNKTRQLCGHEVPIKVPENATIYRVKREIEKVKAVPHQIQWIVFGARNLQDTERLSDYAIRDGYTLYSVPTFIEIPSIPNL
ncbi:unnamed protein product [Cylicocyclus nassatus]|uniref:Ubiquitin-like domain-containing protein n=1 Tax=Cylicocyclus nassatus TaxID=53992 RepID=A0AA36MHK0_CYLNA|nr:unnamed protein product [Cylicocyclus nassatus]